MLRQKLFQAAEFLHYWLSKTDQHSLHSPFLFQFHQKVIAQDGILPWMEKIESMRAELLKSNKMLEINDFGAGSTLLKSNQRTVSDVARYSNTNPKEARLLARMAQLAKPKYIAELGSGLGLQTMYFAEACHEAKIWTFEGAESLAEIALQNVVKFGLADRVELIHGNIDQTLLQFLSHCPNLDMVFIDANHQELPTLSYFYAILKKCSPEAMIIIDDIHWSEGMSKAWKEIITHPDARITIDLYNCGVVFLQPKLTKQHWVL